MTGVRGDSSPHELTENAQPFATHESLHQPSVVPLPLGKGGGGFPGVRWGGSSGRPPPTGALLEACGAGDRKGRPYGGLQEVPACGPMWASAPTEGCKKLVRYRAGGVEPHPYGSGTRGAMGGRPQGSPLRWVARSACVRADVGTGPYGGLQEARSLSSGRGRTPPLRMRCKGGGTRPDGSSGRPTPTDALQGARWGGRPEGSPLRSAESLLF